MPPKIALLICIFFILFLFKVEKRGKSASVFLWIPLIWVLILGSRMVGDWFNVGADYSSEASLEGSPIDRTIFIILIIAGLLVLFRRRIHFSQIVRANGFLFIFLLYCGISILWSDYPFVALKRWIKEFGNIIMVLVILTDPTPVEAIKTLFRRCAYILIPLSIIMIKYFPDLGRIYGRWSGALMVTGVTTNKNSLGILCMSCTLFFIWDYLSSRQNRDKKIVKNELFVNILVLFMTLWLLTMSDSKTSLLCLMIGICILIGMGMPRIKNNIKYIGVYIFFTLFLLLITDYAFDLKSAVLAGLGRDETLTGRTELWGDLIAMVSNPLIGTGYDSFWLGNRLEKLWAAWWWHPTTAHNGYLDIYLSLGMIGLFLLLGFILSAYKNIKKGFISDFEYGRIRLAFLIITVVYNYTESSFTGAQLMWFIFLLIAMESRHHVGLSLSRGLLQN